MFTNIWTHNAKAGQYRAMSTDHLSSWFTALLTDIDLTTRTTKFSFTCASSVWFILREKHFFSSLTISVFFSTYWAQLSFQPLTHRKSSIKALCFLALTLPVLSAKLWPDTNAYLPSSWIFQPATVCPLSPWSIGSSWDPYNTQVVLFLSPKEDASFPERGCANLVHTHHLFPNHCPLFYIFVTHSYLKHIFQSKPKNFTQSALNTNTLLQYTHTLVYSSQPGVPRQAFPTATCGKMHCLFRFLHVYSGVQILHC